MVCSSTSKIGCGRLVDLLFPRFVNMFVSRLSGCVIVISLVVGNALLVDLLAVVLLNTFVSGLFVILLGSSCCLVDTLLDTLITIFTPVGFILLVQSKDNFIYS